MISVNPYDGQTIREYPDFTAEQTSAAVDSAEKAFFEWRGATLTERKVLNLKLRDLLEKKKDELARLMTLEMGKPIKQSCAELEKCGLALSYYSEKAELFLAPQMVETEAQKSYVRFDPLGLVLAVMPWNFPFWQVFRFSAPSVIAGNAALLKHASNVTGCALAIETLYREAGFPENIFRTLLIPGSNVLPLMDDQRIKAATLTGSEAAGVAIAEKAGRNLKKVVLELGGSDPFIVLGDADIAKAAAVAAKARTINNGQSCIAAKRFIVEQSVYDSFRNAFVDEMNKLKVGDPLSEETDVGPLAKREFLEELEQQVERSVKEGAIVLAGGKKPESDGWFYPPTVLGNVKPGNTAFEEEIFGPVAPLIMARDNDHAMKLANSSRFGLGGSIWTSDTQVAEKMAAELEVGTVFINGMVKSDPRLPFGGVKASGFGRELSYFGMREFVNVKTVVIE
ncbi:MAG TPA: NAD-dependent succinate-semialdehyde dehydrogenase [Acidobacteriota bacterium]|nr:NAD-dependent succinate-semialdehyde dehydrogenase [Acidobacteriota bacterium]HNT18247.1 NAD-dependent succinate-semialdehyde dehydrogenase [Acidobacteriota bacterium]HQO19227.1 NAD-dependent succinate-semialdehyde dehydrogenase [Acidobacteriota bacterium]HQQ46039.1 NAD-dependent succinate-semialdehyde dehydrogenase [Acidobacteriota bacterium]